MQYLKYPTKIMAISQNYNGVASHRTASTGTPAAYPIDDCCGDAGRSNFYAPCDLTIKRIYGVGTTGINTIWLESNEKVKLANGNESYVTMLVIHVDDDDLLKLTVGESFKQGEYIFREGRDGYDRGYATGYHFHIEVATCKFSELGNNGWVKNSKGAWVISKNSIKPELAFYVDKDFTTIKTSAGLTFQTMPKESASDSASSTSNSTQTNSTSTNTSYYPKSSYTGTSIVTALAQLNINFSYDYRAKIAAANDIVGYRGTAAQNTKMLNLLKQGKLKKV